LSSGTLIGRNIASSQVFKRAFEGRPTSLIGPNPFDGRPWMYAGRRLDDFGVLVVASRGMEAALAEWRQRTRSALQTAATATVALLLLTAALHTALNRRYEALRRSEERFELAIAGMSEGIWDWYIDRDYVFYSPRFRVLLGYDPGDPFAALSQTFWQHVHPDDLDRTQQAVQRHLHLREPYDLECRLRSKTGEYRWFRTRGQALWREAQAVRMVGAISDIHEQKCAQDALQLARERELRAHEEFSQELLDAQDRERKRIANELHDGLGQNLSLITNRAQLALQRISEPRAREHVDAISQVAAESIAEVRALARNLQPLQIEETGLTDVITALSEQVANASGMIIDSHIEDVDDAFSTTHGTHLYRIVQEALNNIMKHAQASKVSITLERDLRSVRLQVLDNGRGFNASDGAARARGVGIASMTERAHILGGTLQITSKPGAGCVLQLEVPALAAELEQSEEEPPSIADAFSSPQATQ
ncbi:MAG: PAS domain-containing protein, partial [Steroidobacteraceae bacterium]